MYKLRLLIWFILFFQKGVEGYLSFLKTGNVSEGSYDEKQRFYQSLTP